MTTDTVRPKSNNASWLAIPSGQALSVEHPCIVEKVDKAIDMIGGASAISQALEEESDRTFALSFRPDDPAARTVIANRKNANNVLLQISLPRRTGRKRKRGSTDPWRGELTSEPAKQDASYLVQSMADNAGKYNVTALSGISSMHIWRSMPDFAYSTSQIKLLEDVKSKILSQHYPTIKEFQLPQTHGLQDTTTLPPPTWSTQSIPQNYSYRQNPSMKVVNDPTTGQRTLRNTQAAPKIYSYQVQWDTPEYPKTPMPEIPPLAEQSRIFQATVAAIDALFQERPIWTRRALLNSLESHLSTFNVVRFCVAYVAYAVRSGPWRDAYIRLGVDPRTDPKYRIYQSIMLQLVPKSNQGALAPAASAKKPRSKTDKDKAEGAPDVSLAPAQPAKEKVLENRHTYARFWSRFNDPTSHIFDGVSPLPPDGKVWQLCDITDPQLVALRDISEDHIRTVCETRIFGWYLNGTAAKIRVALKAKADALQDGKALDPSVLEGLLKLPERVGPDGGMSTVATRDKDDSTVELDERHEAMTVVPSSHGQTQVTHTSPLPEEALSVYLGDDATKQQQQWAALYRATARTEPGLKPVAGAPGHVRLTKRRNMSNKGPQGSKTGMDARLSQLREGDEELQATDEFDPDQPIDIVDEGQHGGEDVDGNPELARDEEVLPSIEVNDFDMDEGEDSELGLDIDPVIKLEDDVDLGIFNQGTFGDPVLPTK